MLLNHKALFVIIEEPFFCMLLQVDLILVLQTSIVDADDCNDNNRRKCEDFDVINLARKKRDCYGYQVHNFG